MRQVLSSVPEHARSRRRHHERAERLGLISARAYKSFNIRLRKDGMHKAEPGKWSGDETTRRFRRLVHRAAAQELIARSKAAGLLGISLREFDAEFAETATAGGSCHRV